MSIPIANLALEIEGKKPTDNHRATGIELFRRAIELDNASRLLKLDYTYEVIKVSEEKRAARMQLGKMAAEIVELMRDELLLAGMRSYLRGLTKPEQDAILGNGDAG